MRPPGGDAKESPRRVVAKLKKRRLSAKARTKRALDVVGLIEAQFERRVTVTENGKPSRMTVFDAIYRQLWIKEMGGDAKALRARLSYEEFARKQQPERERKIIVIGGLPDVRLYSNKLPNIEGVDDVGR